MRLVGRLLLASLGLAATSAAQPAASAQWFVPAIEFAAGGVSTSGTWRVTGSLGAGVVPQRATTATFVLLGGFPATHEAPVVGLPWLTGVTPLYAPLKGGTTVTLRGTELDLGSNAQVQIGGKSALVGARQRDSFAVTAPAQTVPGWQPVSLTTSLGTTALPRGVGILPMLELAAPAQPGFKFQLDYRGTMGDVVLFILAAGSGPPIPLPGYGYWFELDPFAFLVLTGLAVVDPSGVLSLPLPARPWSRPLLFQCLVISNSPGYRPGAFTNAVRL